MLDLYQLSPEEFECLCYEYICSLYGANKDYQIEHTRYVHDGGRDIEITFYDQLSYFKIWAECKQHKRSIGLDDIGKNVVLVISKHIQQVIFFSASEITESAKIEIANIGDKLNFKVSFLSGKRLVNEIESHPNLIKKFFKNIEIDTVMPREQKITVTCSVSEFESNIIIPINKQKQIHLRNGELFNIYIHLSNQTNKPMREVSVELLSTDNAIKINNTQIKYDFLERQGDIIAHFKGRIIIRQSNYINLPKAMISYRFDNTNKKEIISLPPLDISKCKKYPLIGKLVTEFLSNNVTKALEWSNRNYPQFFDIRGVSGSGKSRLASEIQKKATEQGLHSICLNSSDYIDYDIIHKLLCELLHLPFYKGKINFSKKDVSKLVEIQGGSNTFSSIIADFMQKGVWKKSDTLYIVEAIAYFLQNPYHETGYCISIDNTQTLHPEILKVLIRLTELLMQNQNRTILIFISNTERRVVSQKAFESFLSYFDEKCKESYTTFISYTCSAFKEEDAKLLLMHLFGFKNQNDVLLRKLLQKTGRLPFELTMALEFLSDKNIIEWTDAKEWVINDYDRFDKFIVEGFPKNHTILKDRMTAWKETHSKSMNKKFIDILSTVVAFDGLVPYAYITDNEFDYELIDQLISMLWLAPSPSGRGIAFFHDNIKEFCNTLPQCKNNANVLRKVNNWLDNNLDIDVLHIEKIKFSCYYYLDKFDKALKYGQKILYESTLSHTEIVKISGILYEDSRTKSDIGIFIRIADIYANAIFSLDNKELGCSIYQVIVACIKNNQTAVDSMESCRILHRAINSQLQSAKYATAIEWIDLLKCMPNLPMKYQFIVENRYGVTYIALGQFEKAKNSLNNSLIIASEAMKNLYWTSTAHSDIALYHFYNWKKYGRDVATTLIINEFELAINDYEAYENHNVSRDIEMAWHKAFIDILNEKYDSAISEANECIHLSYHNNHSYELSRGYNLRALAQFFNCDNQDAQNSLEEGLHACTLYGFPSGIFRIYNNLGVIYYSKNDFFKARYYFNLSLNTLDKQIEYKQYPVLTNLLLTSIHLKDNELTNRIERRCEKIGSNELFEYCRILYKHIDIIQQIDSFTFWGFYGASYIF